MEWAQSGDLAQLVKQRAEQGIPFTQGEVWLLFGQVGWGYQSEVCSFPHFCCQDHSLFQHSLQNLGKMP